MLLGSLKKFYVDLLIKFRFAGLSECNLSKKLNATTWKTEFVLFLWKLATGERRGSCKQNDVQIILMQLIDKKGKTLFFFLKQKELPQHD